MKTRTAGILVGLLLLAALYMGFRPKRVDESKDTSTAHSAGQVIKPTSVSSGRDDRAATTRRPSTSNRSSGVSPEQAESEITRVLSDNEVPVNEAAQKLLAIAADPIIAKEWRTDALNHGVTLVDDADYADMVQQYLDENLFEDPELQRIALDDAYNRDDVAKLPASLAVMKHAQGELQAEARELMAFILDVEEEKYGNNYDAWKAAITAHLSKVANE